MRTSARPRAGTRGSRLLVRSSRFTALSCPSLSVTDGVVSGGGKSVSYGGLMGGKTFGTTIAAVNPVLTDPTKYRLIGTRVPRIDIPEIATGKTTYAQSVRVPGMLHGRVVRPRGQAALAAGATLVSVDQGSIAHIPDVQVVQKGNFLGVVAPKEYDAVRAAAQLKVTWSDAPTLTGDGNLNGALRDPANLQRSTVAVNTGDVTAGLASAAKVVSASYFWPYQLHGAMGPNCSIAVVDPQGATVLCMAQGPYTTRQAIATALGLPATSVRVEVFPGSGNYGHNTYDDVSISAALLSQAVGKPVRVQFMRWDEHGWDNFGPAQATDVRAGSTRTGRSSPATTLPSITAGRRSSRPRLSSRAFHCRPWRRPG